jgi:hypothetical protein
MGNACCRSGNEAVAIESKVRESPPRTSAQGNGEKKMKRDEDNIMDMQKKGDEDIIMDMKRRQSDETIWFDALDRFPSDRDSLYPPTQSMRQLPIEFDMQEAETFDLLLNSSFRHTGMGEISLSPPSKGIRPSVALVSKHLSTETPGTQGRGYPGELTEEELETCLKFREELKKRDPAFKQMVMAMYPHEKEAFALCRFLRTRAFDIDDVFAMMQEKNQLENWHTVKRQDPNFFKDFHTAAPEFNGCPLSVLMTQFPIIHTGIGRNGALVCYVKAGQVNCPGVECIVGDMSNAVPFAWNKLYHGCRDALKREIARSDASTTTVLAEKIIVADLEGDSSLFTSGMPFLKASPTAIGCFPEAVNRTYILNAPFSFSIVWAVLRQLIDPRTVKKIGFFSTIAKAKKDFLEHIDSDELLSSYGGNGKSFDEIFVSRQRELAHKEGVVRYVVEVLAMSGRQIGFDFDLSSDETVDSIVVYSRSDNMCEISIVDGKCNYIVDYKNVSREQATAKASFSADAPDAGKSHNNYAVEIATSSDFAANPTGPFFVNTKNGTKGDYFLVAISIAEKR